MGAVCHLGFDIFLFDIFDIFLFIVLKQPFYCFKISKSVIHLVKGVLMSNSCPASDPA